MVSVIIPVFNGAALIGQCLHSVLGQSYKALQVIVVDDGSTDNTYALVEAIAGEDSRIRLVTQKNAGVSAARNLGISLAQGEFVMFVDADDILPADAVSAMVNAADSGVDLVIGSHEEFSGHKVMKQIRKPEIIPKKSFETDALRVEKLVRAAWGKLYRTSIIHENNVRFDTALPLLEDTLFSWQYCRYVSNIRTIDAIAYRYRRSGVTSSMKYFPERYKYLLAALGVYGDFYGGQEKIPCDFLKQKVSSGLMDCLMHYLSHCPAQEAQMRIGATLTGYAPYLSEETIDPEMFPGALPRSIMDGDAKAVADGMWKQFGFRIFLKKVKKQLKNFKIRL